MIELLEPIFGVDQYDPTYLHTVGLRTAGQLGQFDFEVEGAYQFGDVDQIGQRFASYGLMWPWSYGDDDAEADTWGANLEVGYTFDIERPIRVYLGGAYFDGEDNRDITMWQWLGHMINPYYEPEASVCFNRLFSDIEYSEFLEHSASLSNVWIARAGAQMWATEQIELAANVSYFQTVDAFDAPWHFRGLFGKTRVPFGPFSWMTTENEKDLGWEVDAYLTYHYSEDLEFELGYAHLFVGDGLEEGNFSDQNGLWFNGGAGDDDPDYVYLETKITF